MRAWGADALSCSFLICKVQITVTASFSTQEIWKSMRYMQKVSRRRPNSLTTCLQRKADLEHFSKLQVSFRSKGKSRGKERVGRYDANTLVRQAGLEGKEWGHRAVHRWVKPRLCNTHRLTCDRSQTRFCGVRETRLQSQAAWVQILQLPFMSCVALGK